MSMKVVDFFGIKSNSKVKKTRTVKPVPISFLDIKPLKQKNPFDIKPPRQSRRKQKAPSIKQMNWFQVKTKYPKLSPFEDSDKDGVINYLDCKPLNRKKQDVSHNPSPVQISQSQSSQPLGRPALGGESYGGKPSDSHAPIIQGGTKILAGSGVQQITTQIPAQTQTPIKSQAIVSIQPSGKNALQTALMQKGLITPQQASIIQGGTKILAGPGVGTTILTTQIPAQTQTPIKSQAIVSGGSVPPMTYNGVGYTQGKTQAVEVGTGKIAKDNNLNTRNANLEDHYFIKTSSGWKDVGIFDSSKKTESPMQLVSSTQKLYGGMTADQRFAATTNALKQAGDLNKPTTRGIITTAAYYTKPAFTTADPFKVNTALTYAGQLIQSIPGSKLTGFSKQEAEQKREDIMKRAYTEYSYDPKTGKEIGKIEPGMSVGQKIATILEPAYKTSVGQSLIVTAAALPIGYAVGTVLKSAPVVVSMLPEKVVQAGTQVLTSPAGQTVVKTLGAGALAYGGYKAVAEPTIKAYKEGLPSGEVLGTAVTKGLGFGGALAMGIEGVKAGIKAPVNIIEKGVEKGQHVIQRTVEAIPISDKAARLEAFSSSSKFDQMMSKIRTPEERVQIIEQAFENVLTPAQRSEVAKQVAADIAKLK